MKKLIGKSKVWAVLVLIVAFTVTSSASAYAWAGNGGRMGGRGGKDARVVSHGGDNRGGGYSHGGDGHYEYGAGALFGVLAVGAIFGSILASIPQRAPAVVVAAPVVYPQYAAVDDGRVVINVPNARGGYTAITLVRRNNGYVGPQGEYYEWCPSVAQLQVLYGY